MQAMSQVAESMRERTLAILGHEAAEMALGRNAVLGTDDPEALHRLRVAIRRARTALKVFRAFVPTDLAALDLPLRDVFRKLGRVRDLDLAVTLTKDARLRSRLEGERVATADAVRADLRGDEVLGAFAFSLDPGLRWPALADAAAASAAADLVWRVYRASKRAADRAQERPSPEAIHLLRRRLKRLRYTVEFFADLAPDCAQDAIRELKGLQDLLGAYQDDRVYSQGLPGDATEDRAASEARLHRLQAAVLEEAKRFGGKKWRRLRRQMDRARRDLWAGGERGDA